MKTTLRSNDLNCPSCIPKIEKALGAIPGVERTTVHFTTGRIEIDHEQVDPETLRQAIRKLGYETRVSAF